MGRLHNAGRAQTEMGQFLIKIGSNALFRVFAGLTDPRMTSINPAVVLGGSQSTDEGSGEPAKAAVTTVTAVTDRYACARSAGPTDRPLEVRSAQSAGPTDRPWAQSA